MNQISISNNSSPNKPNNYNLIDLNENKIKGKFFNNQIFV
jgi:hypothetical protein